MKRILITAALASMPAIAFSAPVDLSGWIENGFKGNNGAGTWTVSGANDEVFQSINGQPTVFFDATANDQGKSLAGTIEVQTTSDDDFVGFVLGYQDGEFNSTMADFWLIDWKQGDQSGAFEGLALSHVSGDIANGGNADPTLWEHTGTVSEVQRATNLGSTGWSDNTVYSFELVFTEDLIQVLVNGVQELSYSSATHGSQFTDGAFGFYNYSQTNVNYAGITEDVVVVVPPDPTNISIPGIAPLFLTGLGLLAAAKRRRRV